ncbi:unnamed protein product, partial [Mesorhabditis belari]|uniref:Uncharacterized protein n=1 Tax=Mesorhabditis belari TaxID=2138241 RepID=A0AAF3EKC2_9BILA
MIQQLKAQQMEIWQKMKKCRQVVNLHSPVPPVEPSLHEVGHVKAPDWPFRISGIMKHSKIETSASERSLLS